MATTYRHKLCEDNYLSSFEYRFHVFGPTNFNRGSALYGLYFNRGTASRHCSEALGVFFDVVDGLRGVIGRSQGGDDTLPGSGGGVAAAAAAIEVEVLLM